MHFIDRPITFFFLHEKEEDPGRKGKNAFRHYYHLITASDGVVQLRLNFPGAQPEQMAASLFPRPFVWSCV